MSEQKPKLPKFFLVLRIFGSLLMIAGIALIIVRAVGASGFELMVGGLACLVFGFVVLVGSFAPNMQRIEIKAKRYILHENKEDLADISNQTAEVISRLSRALQRLSKRASKKIKSFARNVARKSTLILNFVRIAEKVNSNIKAGGSRFFNLYYFYPIALCPAQRQFFCS